MVIQSLRRLALLVITCHLPVLLANELPLPRSLLGENPNPQQALNLHVEQTQALDASFQSALADSRPFNGLFLTSELAQDIADSEFEHRVGLEWEIFNTGRGSARRNLENRRLEAQIAALQRQVDLLNRRIDAGVSQVHRLRDHARYQLAVARAARLKQQAERAEKRHQAGFLDAFAVEEFRFRLADAELQQTHLRERQGAHLSADVWLLLNRLEQQRLRTSGSYLSDALTRHPEIRLQTFFVKRADQFPKWQDNLQVSLFVEQREDPDIDSEQQFGVRFRVPLGATSRRDDVVRLEQATVAESAEAIKTRVRQQIDDLIGFIGFQQLAVKRAKQRWQTLEKQRQLLLRRDAVDLPLAQTTPPLMQADAIEREQLQIEEDAVLARLTALEHLFRLQGLTLAAQLNALFLPPAEG